MLEHTKLLACALISSLFMSQATYAQEVKANVEVKDTSGVMITDVRLQDDYYNAVNKDWLNSAVIKDGYSGTNAGMEVYYKLNEQKYELVNELIADKKNLDSNSDEKKIVNLYENYLNTEQRNKEGITPIMPILNKIKNIKSLDEINNLDKDNIVNPILSFQCMADLEDSDKYALYINSSTLSLGDSDVYVSPTDMSKKKQELYSKYFIKILTLAGYTEDQAKAKVDNKFKFEYMIATYIMGKEESTKDDDSIKKIYNVLTADELDSMAPNLKIKEYLKNAKVDNANKIILTEPKWFKGLNDIYKEENLQMLKDYIEISNLSAYVSLLSDDFAKAQTEFANELMGSQGETSKEEKAMALVASVLDESLGKAYVEKYFDPEVKTNVESMINDVITNYKSRINNLDWMSDETKSNAIKKLDSLKVNVAYPDKWEDYSALDIKSYD
ncbi:MAG: M13 family metallopeptidase, partial [Romboutsia sp.]|nr:M13 family metallopeptidase [Romboutsia sp.]